MGRVARKDGGSVYTCDNCGAVYDAHGAPGWLPAGWTLQQAGDEGPEFLCGAEGCRDLYLTYEFRINAGLSMYSDTR